MRESVGNWAVMGIHAVGSGFMLKKPDLEISANYEPLLFSGGPDLLAPQNA